MSQWRVHEMSKLTGVSVRMLHHYDEIGLLKPSLRTSNGYRWYSPGDLARLQQIVALRFFGFGLKQIKVMLQQHQSIRSHLLVQKEMLNEQSEQLNMARTAIEDILNRMQGAQEPNWQDLTLLIERYRMKNNLKETWFGKALNKGQLDEYLQLRQRHPNEFQAWEKLIVQINEGQMGSPEGEQAHKVVLFLLDIMKKTMSSLRELRQFNANVLASIKSGEIVDLPLTPEGNVWLAKASIHYWLQRWQNLYQEIVKHVDDDPEGPEGRRIAQVWRTLIEEQLVGMSRTLSMGAMMWQQLVEQKVKLEQQVKPLSAPELANAPAIELVFNAVAFNWIERALNASKNGDV